MPASGGLNSLVLPHHVRYSSYRTGGYSRLMQQAALVDADHQLVAAGTAFLTSLKPEVQTKEGNVWNGGERTRK